MLTDARPSLVLTLLIGAVAAGWWVWPSASHAQDDTPLAMPLQPAPQPEAQPTLAATDLGLETRCIGPKLGTGREYARTFDTLRREGRRTFYEVGDGIVCGW